MTTNEENLAETPSEQKETRHQKKRGLPFWVVFIICGWMFFLGVLVGRGTSPVTFDINELEKKIVELKKSALKSQETDLPATGSLSADTKSELEFYEELKIPEKYHKIPYIEAKPKTPVINPKETESRKPEINSASPSPIPEPAKQLEKPGKNYSIQVASLKDPTDANRLVEEFKRRGYPAYRVSAEVRNTGVWHRVRIGPFKSQSEANRILFTVNQKNQGALILEHD